MSLASDLLRCWSPIYYHPHIIIIIIFILVRFPERSRTESNIQLLLIPRKRGRGRKLFSEKTGTNRTKQYMQEAIETREMPEARESKYHHLKYRQKHLQTTRADMKRYTFLIWSLAGQKKIHRSRTTQERIPGGGGEFVVFVKCLPDVNSLVFGPTNDVTTRGRKRRFYLRREIRGA